MVARAAPGTILLAVEAVFVRRLLEPQLRRAGFRVRAISGPSEAAADSEAASTLIVGAGTLERDPEWREWVAARPQLALVVVGVADLDGRTRKLLRGRRGAHLRNALDLPQALRTIARVQGKGQRAAAKRVGAHPPQRSAG